MKKRLYLCRHGQTVYNNLGLAQGCCDSPLTELGKEQALNAKSYFDKNNIKYDVVYCSPLGRAKETCQIITGKVGICLDGLKEVNFGSLEGTNYLECRKYHDDYTSIGGENREMATKRIYETLFKIMDKASGDILVVSHATVGRYFYYKVMGYYDPLFKIPNCGISIYDFKDGTFEFVKMVDPNA